jgi:hypothetical protein
MSPRTRSATQHELATGLTTSVGQAMLDGGFSTFVPQLRVVAERIRLGTPARLAAVVALRTLFAAFRRRQMAEPGRLQAVADVQVAQRQVGLLVSYHGRWAALNIADGVPEANWRRDLHTAGIALAEQIYPEEVTGSEVADKLVDRFLHDLANAP